MLRSSPTVNFVPRSLGQIQALSWYLAAVYMGDTDTDTPRVKLTTLNFTLCFLAKDGGQKDNEESCWIRYSPSWQQDDNAKKILMEKLIRYNFLLL